MSVEVDELWLIIFTYVVITIRDITGTVNKVVLLTIGVIVWIIVGAVWIGTWRVNLEAVCISRSIRSVVINTWRVSWFAGTGIVGISNWRFRFSNFRLLLLLGRRVGITTSATSVSSASSSITSRISSSSWTSCISATALQHSSKVNLDCGYESRREKCDCKDCFHFIIVKTLQRLRYLYQFDSIWARNIKRAFVYYAQK